MNCSYLDCDIELIFPEDFNCKFCKKKFCSKHIQLEKHECVKTMPVKYIRKTWLRKYSQNISSGRYLVVCDVCEYFSEIPSAIDMAAQEREHHINTQGCDGSKVFLEEDLSHEQIPKDVVIETVVPSDRTFWVCAHCRPPQKFTDRTKYVAHHFIHQ